MAGAAALRTFGLALGLFSMVGTGRPADLGEGGNSLALSPRFGPKLLRHLSCPSSFTTPLERGKGRGTGLGLAAPYPHATLPSASLCVHHVSWKAKALWEDEPGSWSWAQFSQILGRLSLPGVRFLLPVRNKQLELWLRCGGQMRQQQVGRTLVFLKTRILKTSHTLV